MKITKQISYNTHRIPPMLAAIKSIITPTSIAAVVAAAAKAVVAAPGKNAAKNKKKRYIKRQKSKRSAIPTSSAVATIPQSCKMDWSQVLNHAGGYVWNITLEEHVMRYLIMGSKDMGNFYQTSAEVSLECSLAVLKMVADTTKFKTLCDMLKSVSLAGRAAKQEPTLLSIAAAIVFAPTHVEKKMAYDLITTIPKSEKQCCIRTPTHVFMLLGYVNSLSKLKTKGKGKGWGHGLKTAICSYYYNREGRDLAFSIMKYQNREGWTHADVIRMIHLDPSKLKDDGARLIIEYVMSKHKRRENDHSVKGKKNILLPNPHRALSQQEFSAKLDSIHLSPTTTEWTSLEKVAHLLKSCLKLQNEKNPAQAVKIIEGASLVRENIPTTFMNSFNVWESMLPNMQPEALMRNLGKLTTFKEFEKHVSSVVQTLTNADKIRKSMVHPFKILVASKTYGNGKGDKGTLTWIPNTSIKSALSTMFEKSFGNLEPTGKKYMVAMDISGSMMSQCMGCQTITCREASAALAFILYKIEPRVLLRAFTAAPGSSSIYGSSHLNMNLPNTGFYNLDSNVHKQMDLEQFTRETGKYPFGSTDCSLPMVQALSNKEDVDVFIITTDNETYAGKIHPQEALKQYREQMNKPNAKLIVIGMTANSLTIADPNDKNTLNLCGFDTSSFDIISMFVRGEI